MQNHLHIDAAPGTIRSRPSFLDRLDFAVTWLLWLLAGGLALLGLGLIFTGLGLLAHVAWSLLLRGWSSF